MFKLGTPEKRALAARDIVRRRKNELIHKNTRVGSSTNIISRAAEYEKKLLSIGPTIRTCTDMVEEGIALSIRKDARYEYDCANKEGECFKERCRKTPSLMTDGKVVNIDSNKCAYKEKGKTTYCEHYNYCQVTKLLRIDLSKVDIITITHAKFASYQRAHQHWLDTKHMRKNELPPIPVQKYQKLRKWCNIVFYDECHYLELPDITSKLIYKNNTPIKYDNLRQYAFKNEDGVPKFPLIEAMVEHYIELLEHPRIIKVRNEVIGRAGTENHWKVHLCDSIRNPYKFIFRDENGQPYEHQESGMLEFFDLMLELIEHIGNKNSHRTSEDINTLYCIAKIITADIIALSSSRTGENISVELLVNDDSKRKNTAHLMRKFNKAGKKIIMTSATIGEHDYGQYLGKGYLKTFWGGNGDPLNTNANMMVLCDSRTYDLRNVDYGLLSNLDNITDQIIRYLNAYGNDDVIIFAMSKHGATVIKDALAEKGHYHYVDYYGSPSSVGVSNDARVVISVLLAEKPSNMCDCMFTDNDESKRMRLGLVHAATYQGISRGKCPNGKIPSLVILLGVREDKARAMLTWGSNRKVIRDEDGKVQVTCDQYIPMPHIKECSNYDEMFAEAIKFKAPPVHDSDVAYIKESGKSLKNESEASRNFTDNDEETSTASYERCRCGEIKESDKSLTNVSKTNQELEDFYSQNKYVVTVIVPIFPIEYYNGRIDFMTVTRYLYLNKIIGRHDIFDQMDDEGEFFRQNQDVDTFIAAGCHTDINRIAVCLLSVDNKVGCMYFDIKGSAIGNKNATSQQNKHLICNFLDSQNISYYLEEEKFSFKVWLFFREKIEARSARDFGKAVLKVLSIKEGVEVYPKKCINNKNSKGDFIKLPSFNIKQISSVCTTVKQEG